MEGLDPTQTTAILLFSAILPILISFVKQSGWSETVNALVAFVCYIVVGVVAALTSGIALSLDNIVPLVAVVTTVGTVAYHMFWNNLGTANGTQPSLESLVTDNTSIIKGS